jgi:hypothetical protein
MTESEEERALKLVTIVVKGEEYGVDPQLIEESAEELDKLLIEATIVLDL